MSYLLDTCILSKLRKIKKHPDNALESWFSSQRESACFISVLSVGEIQKGIAKLLVQDQTKKAILENWLISDLIPRFEGRILQIDVRTVLIWGDLCGKAQRRGILLPVIDSFLAASAIQHHLTLITENEKDFIETGVRLLNPCILKQPHN